jgi:hypothetical protein
VTIQSDTPLPQIRLEILPEVQNRNSSALANEIGREIFHDLKNQGYHIESAYTGKMGGNVFLIWLSQLASTVGPILATAGTDLMASKSVEKLVDVIKRVFERVKASKHKALPVTIEVKSPHSDQINVHGPLVETFETLLPTLQKLQEQSAKGDGGQQITEITMTTITIKVSSSQTHNHP